MGTKAKLEFYRQAAVKAGLNFEPLVSQGLDDMEGFDRRHTLHLYNSLRVKSYQLMQCEIEVQKLRREILELYQRPLRYWVKRHVRNMWYATKELFRHEARDQVSNQQGTTVP